MRSKSAPEQGPDLFDDDLFAFVQPARAPRTAVARCVACDILVTLPLDAPARLCQVCGADVAKTYQELRDGQARLVQQQATACSAFDVLIAALADDQRTRWQNITTARARGVKADRIAAIESDDTDPLCAVLRAEAATTRTLHFAANRLAQIARAIAELESTVLSTPNN